MLITNHLNLSCSFVDSLYYICIHVLSLITLGGDIIPDGESNMAIYMHSISELFINMFIASTVAFYTLL